MVIAAPKDRFLLIPPMRTKRSVSYKLNQKLKVLNRSRYDDPRQMKQIETEICEVE